MNRLQWSVAYKREKRRLEQQKEKEKLKQEPKVDMVAEGLGLVFAIGGLMAMFKILL